MTLRAAARSLPRRGRVVHLHGRRHIDLLRVAGALCRR
ncbi:putative leader peptide [Actinacidiphila reveromycinica]